MQPWQPDAVFAYPVYMSAHSAIDVVADWGQGILDVSHDLDLVLAQPFKIAALPVFYDQPGHWAYDVAVAALDLSQFDLVLFSDPEYAALAEIRAWAPECNWILAYGGQRSDESACADREIYRPYYIRDFLKQNSWQDLSAPHKPFLFDALLGSRRPHRDFVFQALQVCSLEPRCVVTYRTEFPGALTDALTQQVADFFQRPLQVPYVSANLDPAWEVVPNVQHWHSRLSPTEIYRHCWYSIICETQHTGSHFFLSEKTIKAMFNHRIFVMFGPAGYLNGLRAHGFETFGHVLDETYDLDHRDLMRWQKAMHQVWDLAWFRSPVKTYEICAEVLEHNRSRLFELENCRCRDQAHMLRCHVPGQHWHALDH